MTINLAAIESRNEERRRLRDAATPGPWWRIDPPWGYGDTVHAGNTDDPHGARAFICTSVPMEDDLCESSNVSDDMALIAYARTDTAPEDIAALVAEVWRLEKAVQVETAAFHAQCEINKATSKAMKEAGLFMQSIGNAKELKFIVLRYADVDALEAETTKTSE